MALLKSEFLPPHLAEYIPGFLFKISISKPESSAKHIKFVFLEKYFDLIKEFSLNDLPFSLGLFNLNSAVDNVTIFLGNKSLISFNLPLLLVPITNFLIFFF